MTRNLTSLRKAKEDVALLLKGARDLETKEMEVLNDFFALVFASERTLQQSQTLIPEEKSVGSKT